jgi:uncharacterized membrane-anchored protein YitT (DUF2179 family)
MGGQRLVPALGIALGTGIIALGLNLFLVPNGLNDGGLTAVAVVAHDVWHLPLGATLFALNVPLFFLSGWRLGLDFVGRSLWGTALLSMWLTVIPEHPLVRDLLLATVYGGAVSGLGTGVVFRFRGSTGGTDLAAWLLRSFLRVSSGRGLLAVDAAVIGLTGLVMGARLAMYSAFALFLGTRVVDLVQEGSEGEKVALILSRRPEEIAGRILRDLGRGVTSLPARGMYTGQERQLLLVALSRREIARLKDMVAQEDEGAFLLVLPAGEVLGEGFERLRPPSRRLLRIPW